MTSIDPTQRDTWKPSFETCFLVGATIVFLPVLPISILAHDLVINLSADFQAGGSYDKTNIKYEIQRWVVSSIIINIFSIIFAIRKMVASKPKGTTYSRAEVYIMMFFTANLALSLGFLLFMFYPKADFTIMVSATFTIYLISDLSGIRATSSQIVENVKFRYNLFSIEIPTLFVLGLILVLNFYLDFDHDKLIFISAGVMILTSFAYAFVNQYVVKHAEDNFRYLKEQVASSGDKNSK